MSLPAPTSAPAPLPSSEPAGRSICPHCEDTFPAGSDACPRCQFSLVAARRRFPFTAPPLDFVVDPGGLLPAGAEEALRKTYSPLREAFPQVRVTLALLNLAPGTSPREFAFWWFNEAPGETSHRAWHLLLLFDAQSRVLCLTPGRALEPVLQLENWRGALQKVSAAGAIDWPTALQTFLKIAPILLETDWRQSQPRTTPAP